VLGIPRILKWASVSFLHSLCSLLQRGRSPREVGTNVRVGSCKYRYGMVCRMNNQGIGLHESICQNSYYRSVVESLTFKPRSTYVGILFVNHQLVVLHALLARVCEVQSCGAGSNTKNSPSRSQRMRLIKDTVRLLMSPVGCRHYPFYTVFEEHGALGMQWEGWTY
jgi:hypothetical protein